MQLAGDSTHSFRRNLVVAEEAGSCTFTQLQSHRISRRFALTCYFCFFPPIFFLEPGYPSETPFATTQPND